MSEREAIKSLKEFAYTIHGTLSAEEAKIVLNLIEKLQKENEEYKKFLEKTIKEYIPDYKLEELVNRYKNESFIPRVEVKKILEDRRK